MKYAQIRNMDISNGEGIGVAMFVQGCHFHCENCFNQETWDFDGGKEWDAQIEKKFMELIGQSFVKRVSILGGEPLADRNVNSINSLLKRIRFEYPDKKIWLYTGYTWEQIMSPANSPTFLTDSVNTIELRKKVALRCDVIVDGPYIHNLRDVSLAYRGSSNQRLIDVRRSFVEEKVVTL